MTEWKEKVRVEGRGLSQLVVTHLLDPDTMTAIRADQQLPNPGLQAIAALAGDAAAGVTFVLVHVGDATRVLGARTPTTLTRV